MRWQVGDPPPPDGHETLVDGELVRDVRELDTEAGYIVKLCKGEKPGHPTTIHVDPERPHVATPCEVRLEGDVEFLVPDSGGRP